ncbi:MAG: 4a-hydroxytetrahydrobiopterin dehydratase [Limnobacter sp.]|nr:4a-hydroxytetrahydrobiopterin dehydratase [Limnobacter sp.]
MTIAGIQLKSPAEWVDYQCMDQPADQAWPQHLINEQLAQFEGWSAEYEADGNNPTLFKTYTLGDFDLVKKALAAVVDIADKQDHHPTVEFSFGYLMVKWNTHSTNGISSNDWACAARCDQAIGQKAG